jgi:hypothetical protein
MRRVATLDGPGLPEKTITTGNPSMTDLHGGTFSFSCRTLAPTKRGGLLK